MKNFISRESVRKGLSRGRLSVADGLVSPPPAFALGSALYIGDGSILDTGYSILTYSMSDIEYRVSSIEDLHICTLLDKSKKGWKERKQGSTAQ